MTDQHNTINLQPNVNDEINEDMEVNMDYEVEALLVEVAEEPVALCQLLKIANLVSGGGEAKIVISEGYVLLNNEVEYQKRKKVYENDIVEFNGDFIQVIINKNSKPDPLFTKAPANSDKLKASKAENGSKNKAKSKPKSKSKQTKVEKKQAINDIEQDFSRSIKSGRKPISF